MSMHHHRRNSPRALMSTRAGGEGRSLEQEAKLAHAAVQGLPGQAEPHADRRHCCEGRHGFGQRQRQQRKRCTDRWRRQSGTHTRQQQQHAAEHVHLQRQGSDRLRFALSGIQAARQRQESSGCCGSAASVKRTGSVRAWPPWRGSQGENASCMQAAAATGP